MFFCTLAVSYYKYQKHTYNALTR